MKRSIIVIIGSILFLFSGVAQTNATFLLYDDFDTFDISKWSVIKNQGGSIYTDSGNLHLTGGGHKRVDSLQKFSLSTASAYIKIGGDYQKFGFNVNDKNGLPAFYFDSYEVAQESPGGVGTIHAIVFGETWDNQDYLLLERFDVTWDEYHKFDIMWGADSIKFFIDDELKASFSYSYSSSTLPVGIWNDRASMMLVDEVSIEPIPEPATMLLLGSGLIGLAGFRKKLFKK